MTTYYVYAIASTENDWIYVGMTDNVIRRFNEHQRGHEKTTKPYKPFFLIYSEESADRPSARIREKYWKAASGKRKLRFIREQLIGGSNLPD
jgi:putative endonuclease